jgi:ABC-type phosphate transport system substrate-binding protein
MKNNFRATRVAAFLSIGIAAFHEANADVVVIVSAKSATTSMTAQQVSDVYFGRSNTLKPIDNSDKSSVRAEFYSKVTGRDLAQVKAFWAKLIFTGKASPPRELPTNEAVVSAVAANPNAIGYVDKSAVDSSVKVVFEAR